MTRSTVTTRSNRNLAIIFAAVATLLIVVSMSVPPSALFSGDSCVKYWQTIAFADGGCELPGLPYPAADFDPSARHIPPFTLPVGDRLAGMYPFLFPLLAAGPVALGGDALLRVIPLLASFWVAWLAGRFAARIRGEPVEWLVATCVLAATPLAFYAVAFYGHSLAAVLIVIALGLVAPGPTGAGSAPWRWAVFGLLLGLGGWIRTEVMFLAPIAAFPLVSEGIRIGFSKAAISAAGFFSGFGVGALVQRATLGSWLPLHVSYHIDSSFFELPFFESRLSSIAAFLAPHWSCGLTAAVWLIAVAAVLWPASRSSRASLVLALACVPLAIGTTFIVPLIRWSLGARPTEAFPYAAPAAIWILISGLPVLLWGQRDEVLGDRRRWFLVLVAAWLPVAVFISRAIQSFEWGARLFLPSIILLTIVMFSLPWIAGKWAATRRAAVVVAIAAAVAVQALGLVLFRHGALTHHQIATAVSDFTSQDEVVVSDSYIVPMVSGRGWLDRRYLYCKRDRGLQRLLGRFAEAGIAEWTFARTDHGRGPYLSVGSELLGPGGVVWIRQEQHEQRVRSRRLRMWRYRRP
jgi:hypothetical protein